MQTINVRKARQNLFRLLDAVEGGETIVITRKGKAVARLEKVRDREFRDGFPDRSLFRSRLPTSTSAGSDQLRNIRDEQG